MVRKAMEKDMEFEPGVKNVYHKVWERYTALPIDNPQPKTEKITLNGRTYELGYKDDICVFSGSKYLEDNRLQRTRPPKSNRLPKTAGTIFRNAKGLLG